MYNVINSHHTHAPPPICTTSMLLVILLVLFWKMSQFSFTNHKYPFWSRKRLNSVFLRKFHRGLVDLAVSIRKIHTSHLIMRSDNFINFCQATADLLHSSFCLSYST